MSVRDDQLDTLKVDGKDYEYYRIADLPGIDHLPYSLKVLVENLVRNIDGVNITDDHVKALLDWDPAAQPSHEIQFTPSRVVMQDFTGVPCIVDLATMRDAVKDLGGDPEVINPQVQSDMVIDHSVQIDKYGIADAVEQNMDIEYQRNGERYQFLRWGQQAFKNFRVVPPGTGIIHQVNIEYLAKVIMTKVEENGGKTLAYLDSCVGTDSHTTTVNGLGVLGWGVGGIEAEAAMLGQPISMLVPRVVGFKLTGSIPEGVTATDVVLTITDMLRQHGVVGKFVEFYGDGIASVPLANRATIGNMGPEFGSTCGIFPIDGVTLDYLRLTGRSEEQIALVEAYAKANKLWGDTTDPNYVEPQYSEYLELDLGTVVPSIAGPKRPQDRIKLSESKAKFVETLLAYETDKTVQEPVAVSTDFRGDFDITNGDVAIASITSCTNTSNPSVMIAAGLIARNAHAKGLKPKPWVKTSLAPGSQVVADYLKAAGLQDDLDALGYQLVGFGCATCIGNSGPLLPEISEAINANDLTVTSVLSGNRNFEGRISPDVSQNYLMQPANVIAYAIAGTMDIDLEKDPLGADAEGNPVFYADIVPAADEVAALVDEFVTADLYEQGAADMFEGDAAWQALGAEPSDTFAWDDGSTYVRRPPYFDGMTREVAGQDAIEGARVLGNFGDFITTDHISPAGAIAPDMPAAEYLEAHGVAPADFNTYGSRRGNHEVMMRGTFANVKLQNKLAEGKKGGWTRDFATGEVAPLFDAAMGYETAGEPLVVLAGKMYGSGSSRDWAAKGPALLGIRAAFAESFARIHRSNLIGMGILPLQFIEGQNAETLGLDGSETITVAPIDFSAGLPSPAVVKVTAEKPDGSAVTFDATVRIDTPTEGRYYENGGILQYVLRDLIKG